MPHSDVHKQKKKKNLTILAMIFLWCVLIFFLTMVKMARADEGHSHSHPHNQSNESSWRGGNSSQSLHHAKSWKVPKGSRYEDRLEHSEKIRAKQDEWKQQYHEDTAPIRMGKTEDRDADRAAHHDFITVTGEKWTQDHDSKMERRNDAQTSRLHEREEHLQNLENKSRDWWESWIKKYNNPDNTADE